MSAAANVLSAGAVVLAFRQHAYLPFLLSWLAAIVAFAWMYASVTETS